jgi:hypothetical protein
MSDKNTSNDDIARVAYAIWEAEGQPHGMDSEHWTRARQLVEDGRADAEFPGVLDGSAPPRPVQPGFEDVPPGIVPDMKADAGPELEEEPGGRFAKQISDLPETESTEQGAQEFVPASGAAAGQAAAGNARPRARKRAKDPGEA